MDDLSLLYARFEDLLKIAQRKGCASTNFLSPRESLLLQSYITFSHPDISYIIDGGYPDAERKLVFIMSDTFEEAYLDKSEYYRLVCLQGSGYFVNTHRDYLGALLALGISRDMIGDIYVNENMAYVFVLPRIEEFLLSQPSLIQSVGRDKVKVFSVDIDVANTFVREFQEIAVTVASTRLDCVVSAIIGVSREKCEKMLVGGMISLNYEIATRAHSKVDDSDVISVRGYGKFVVRLTGMTSKKGKIKIIAMKYI